MAPFVADATPAVIAMPFNRAEGHMAVSRFLIGGVASALLLTGGLFMWKGYTQIAEEEVLPAPPPALATIPVASRCDQ